jgi:hypothetical protein
MQTPVLLVISGKRPVCNEPTAALCVCMCTTCLRCSAKFCVLLPGSCASEVATLNFVCLVLLMTPTIH